MSYQIILTRAARKGLEKAPRQVQDKFLDWAESIRQFGLVLTRRAPSFHDEPLKGPRQGQRSVRLNAQWRALYVEDGAGKITITVLEVTAHDYRTR